MIDFVARLEKTQFVRRTGEPVRRRMWRIETPGGTYAVLEVEGSGDRLARASTVEDEEDLDPRHFSAEVETEMESFSMDELVRQAVNPIHESSVPESGPEIREAGAR
ncbi:MAG: hypothetical protein ABEK01_01685 [Candidatus Nanohaloarchaea archaeon]